MEKTVKQINLEDLKHLLASRPSTSANKESLWTWIYDAEEVLQHITKKAEEKMAQQEQEKKAKIAEAWKSSIVRIRLSSEQITPAHFNHLQEMAAKHGTRSFSARVGNLEDLQKVKTLAMALRGTYEKDGKTWIRINPRLN